MNKSICILIGILVILSVRTFAIDMFVAKGKITKIDERNAEVFKVSGSKSILGTEIIFFDLNKGEPTVYKDYIKTKKEYSKTYEDDTTIILFQKDTRHYVNYFIINKATNKFMFIESQIFSSDFSNSIYWGDLH